MRERFGAGALAGVVLACVLALAPTVGAQTTRLTGTISDSMCGAKHMMAGSTADCTRKCVKEGSDYALVVGDKVYTLKGGNAATLSRLAGKTAIVAGELQGTTLQVASIRAAVRK